MNALVVYFSQFGNTRRVAETIAEVLASADEARVMSLDGLTVAELADVDLIVVGSPTHYQNLPKQVRAALGRCPGMPCAASGWRPLTPL